MTQTGRLVQGIQYNGVWQKDFEIRRGTIGDFVALYDGPLAARSERNAYFQMLALAAIRLVKLGDIPKEDITPELLEGLTEADFNLLNAASRGLVPPSGEADEAEAVDDDSRADEAGLQLVRSKKTS